jgi:hypothetical protein
MSRWLALGSCVLALGCAETYVIRPTQVSVFNDELKTNEGVQKVLRIETASGQIVEINPPVVITVTMSDGQARKFCSPIRADFEGGFLAIHHACGSPARLNGREIDKVEVQEW